LQPPIVFITEAWDIDVQFFKSPSAYEWFKKKWNWWTLLLGNVIVLLKTIWDGNNICILTKAFYLNCTLLWKLNCAHFFKVPITNLKIMVLVKICWPGFKTIGETETVIGSKMMWIMCYTFMPFIFEIWDLQFLLEHVCPNYLLLQQFFISV
jgi:hypothetical protein